MLKIYTMGICTTQQEETVSSVFCSVTLIQKYLLGYLTIDDLFNLVR